MGRTVPWVALSILGVGGCGDGGLGSPRQLGDTTFVFSPSPLRGEATLREVSRVGMIDGPPEYLLGGSPAFTVGPDGSLFVADIRGDLRSYDPDGRFVRTLARQGEGPGEVTYVVGMDVSVDGRLAVLDFGNGRVSVFSADGDLVRDIRLRPSAGRPGYGRDAVRWDERGELWIALHPPRSGPDTLGARRRPLYGRLAGHEEVRDTLFLPPRAWEGCERRLPTYATGFFEDRRVPHMPFAHWAGSRSGALAFGCSARYAFDLVRPRGGVTRISRAWEPPLRTDGEVTFFADVLRMPISRPPGAQLSAPSPLPELPRERPAFLRLWLAQDGRTWAWPGAPGRGRATTVEERRRMPPGIELPPMRWTYWNPTDGFDVFGADGRWIGRVRTPERWAAAPYPGRLDPYFRGDTVWAVLRDEFDVAYIARLEVEWPSPD